MSDCKTRFSVILFSNFSHLSFMTMIKSLLSYVNYKTHVTESRREDMIKISDSISMNCIRIDSINNISNRCHLINHF